MTQTPREAAEAKIAALQWASKALRSLGTWDAVKAIDERIAALALPAPSTAEGKKVVYPAICLPLVLELATLRDDLARMKAAMERIVEVGTRNETQVVGDMWDFVGGYNDYTIVSEEANIATEALAALKGISP